MSINKISVKDYETYEKIKTLLIEENFKYYTFTPKHIQNKHIERFYTDSVKDWLTELVKLWPGVNAG